MATVESAVNPVPYIRRAATPVLIGPEFGEISVSVGAGGFEAVKGSGADVPPPGAGVVTVKFTAPGEAMLAAGMVTGKIRGAVQYMTGRLVPF